MARIPRKTQKIFGGNLASSPSSGLGIFGSLANGAAGYSPDPNVIQSLPKWLAGWKGAFYPGSKQAPCVEDFNAILYVLSYNLAHTLQSGVPEWDSNTDYHIGNLASDGSGNIYKSLTNSNIGNSLSNSSHWATLIDPAGQCKAWVSFNGVTGAVYSSYGIASVVKEATGTYMITFTNAFSSATSYVWQGTCGSLDGSSGRTGNNNHLAGGHDTGAYRTASQLRVFAIQSNSPTNMEDADIINVTFFGR